MPSSDWVHFFAPVPQSTRASVAALLNHSGHSPSPMPGEPEGYGLMVLNAVDEYALECIRAASRRAVVLVLAVAPCRAIPRDLWAFLQAGAADVLMWSSLPANAEQVRARLARLSTVRALSESTCVSDALVGSSSAWRGLLRQVVELAVFANGPVLVTGESGTGKELIARLIHDLDPRERTSASS